MSFLAPIALFRPSLGRPEEEITDWTARAHRDFRTIVREARAPMIFADLGPELRAFNTRTGVTFAVFGQYCAPGGKQGTHPSRIALYRQELAPCLFVAIQGPIGWGAWCGISGREPGEEEQRGSVAIVRHHPGAEADVRAGWMAKDMIKLSVLEPVEGRVALDPNVTAPEPVLSGSLF